MPLMPIYDEVTERLRELDSQRALAALEGMGEDSLYVQDLLDEMRALHAAYVGAAVTAIASLRGELGERNSG